MLKKIKCAYCGKEFECSPSRIEKVKNPCCSVECANNLKKLKNLNCKCSYCGKLFHKKPSHITTYNYCSKECMNLHRKEIYKGENNPNAFCRIPEMNKIIHCGYYWVYMPDHPLATKNGYIREHRLIAEKELATNEQLICINGQNVLNPALDVHHIDENKLNNDVKNLQIVTTSEHMQIHGEKKTKKVKKICKNCGKEYEVINSRKETSKFCCKECMDEFKKKNMIEDICPVCGKTFSHSKNMQRTCCSVECSNIFKRRKTSTVKCDNCGKLFKIKNSRLKKSKHVFCCRDCYAEYKKNN